jgi:uncharacterized RDD family membrane protein YckC
LHLFAIGCAAFSAIMIVLAFDAQPKTLQARIHNAHGIMAHLACVYGFGKVLSHMILNIGYIMAAFTEKKQALHDILAGSLVVDVSPISPLPHGHGSLSHSEPRA